MGWSFRKSLRSGPFRLNFSKRGVGVSTGVRGLRAGRSADGRKQVTFSIPGTGIRWQKSVGGKGGGGCVVVMLACLALPTLVVAVWKALP
jgi:hypothetical protein